MSFVRPLVFAPVMASALVTGRRGQGQPAEPPLAIAMDVVTVDSCPAERFERALESRVRRRFEVRRDSPATLRVAITAAGASLQAKALFSGASGQAARSVSGTCDEITSALALVATTWLEAEPAAEPSAAAAPSPPRETSIATSPSTPAEARPTQAGPRKRFSLGAQGITTFGLVGGPAAGVALSFAYESDRFELRSGLRGALGGETRAVGRARYAWSSAAFDGCFHALTGTIVRVAGCARLEPGVFHASFVGTDGFLPWLALGPGVRLGWSIAPPVRLELEAFGSFPVTGYRITPSGATLAPFPNVAAALAAGLMVPFM